MISTFIFALLASNICFYNTSKQAITIKHFEIVKFDKFS